MENTMNKAINLAHDLRRPSRRKFMKSIIAEVFVVSMIGCAQEKPIKAPIPTVVTVNEPPNGFRTVANCPEGWMVDYDHDLIDDKDQTLDYLKGMVNHLHCRHEFPREKDER